MKKTFVMMLIRMICFYPPNGPQTRSTPGGTVNYDDNYDDDDDDDDNIDDDDDYDNVYYKNVFSRIIKVEAPLEG